MTFEVGTIIDGKYRIEGVLGRGGMGVVYAAHHELLGQSVALKVVLPEIAQNEEVVARFMNEARAAAKIQSDHVARVMDVGRLADGTPFMVMERLNGTDLEALVETQGPRPAEEIADLLLQALDGVAHAHSMGIVHRDLKPANLFVAKKSTGGVASRVKVLDFGISKALSGTPFGPGGLTSTKSILGSPAYMAPEQLRSSRTVDARADLWSLGVIAYQLATGKLPYDHEDVGGLFAAILEDAPKPPRELVPGLPEGIERVILRCLQKKPDARFQTALELAQALAPFGSRISARALEQIEQISTAPTATVSGPAPALIASEAFAATHISHAGLREKVPELKTDGNWSEPLVGKKPKWGLWIAIAGVLILGLTIAAFGRSLRTSAAASSTPVTESQVPRSAASTASTTIITALPALLTTPVLPTTPAPPPVESSSAPVSKPVAPKASAKPAASAPGDDIFSRH